MVLGTRMKKSQNGSGKLFNRRKSDKHDSDENDKFESKFSRKSRDGEFKTFKRQTSYARDEYDGESRSPRRGRGDFGSNENGSYRKYGERGESRYSFAKKNSEKSGRDGESKMYGRKALYGKERNFSRGNSNDETRGTRQLRGNFFYSRGNSNDDARVTCEQGGTRNYSREGSNDGTRAARDPRSFRGKRGVIIQIRSPIIDQLKYKEKSRKRKDVSGNNFEEGTSHRPMRIMRRDRVSKDKKEEENDESLESVEASSDKLRLKWKKMDKKQVGSDGDNNNQDKGAIMDKSTKNGDGGNTIIEEKPIKRLTRVLNKFGRKLKVVKTSLRDGSEEKIAPIKKKKRAMKLDPYDLSNKRLDDSAPVDDHAEKSKEKDSEEISQNAQFRAIQPSPSILSFVEDNLLGRRRLNELKDAGYNVKLSAPLDNIPFSTNTERERIEENMFRSKLEFFAAAKISSSFPLPVVPEIAFAGRSNVGKSSLLNALTRQWGVVRTSDKPGLTQTINFFTLDSKLSLVDLPGYGFAYAKEEVKEAWEELVKEYVSTRVGLQRVCLLIDTKWGMKPRDHELIDLMERSKTPYQIVLTKTDLVFPIDVARRAMQIQENLKRNQSIINPLAMVSSKSGAGVRKLRSVLSKITRFVKL